MFEIHVRCLVICISKFNCFFKYFSEEKEPKGDANSEGNLSVAPGEREGNAPQEAFRRIYSSSLDQNVQQAERS